MLTGDDNVSILMGRSVIHFAYLCQCLAAEQQNGIVWVAMEQSHSTRSSGEVNTQMTVTEPMSNRLHKFGVFSRAVTRADRGSRRPQLLAAEVVVTG